MEERTVLLPEHSEMLQRLCAVCNDEHVVDHVYFLVLQAAGTTKTARTVVWLVLSAMAGENNGLGAMARMMPVQAEDLIAALLANEPDVAAEAAAYYEEAKERSGKTRAPREEESETDHDDAPELGWQFI